MRTLMDEVRNHLDKITVLEFMPTVELIMDNKGRCAGGILYNMETEEYFMVKAKATIIATGGYGRLHINGGVEINDHCESNIPGLFVAGEASGGVHGRNRLMGNSVLDYNVFGRRAGKYAAEYTKSAKPGKLTLKHITAYENELKKARIKTDRIAPVLLPSYTPEDVRRRQLTARYEGTLR
jgi:succinate dehydrogenase/fumarate reductase flavoprotein subunit